MFLFEDMQHPTDNTALLPVPKSVKKAADNVCLIEDLRPRLARACHLMLHDSAGNPGFVDWGAFLKNAALHFGRMACVRASLPLTELSL